MKQLADLPQDIFALFDPNVDHQLDEENLDVFLNDLRGLIKRRLGKQEQRTDALRFSVLGRPDRQVWYRAHSPADAEQLRPKDQFKYLYGDILEVLLLLLAKEAGHTVEDEQKEVELDGIKGHIDAKIDGVVSDIKSASPFGYKKFEQNMVEQDDPFGYVQQLAGYGSLLTPEKDAAWLAVNKVDGSICVSMLSKHSIAHYPPEKRIAELKAVVGMDHEPPRCYPDVEDGKSGNRKLGTACSYCAFKHRCWPGLRTFLYSQGPRYLTQIGRIPDVPEVNAPIEMDEE